MMKFILGFFLLLSNIASAKLILTTKDATSEIKSFILEVEGILPFSFHAINRTLELRFEKLDTFNQLESPCKKKEGIQKFGKLEKNKITLNRNFLAHLSTNTKSIDFHCGHKTFRKLAIATLIHELAHVYDEENKISNKAEYLSLAHVIKSFPLRFKTKNKDISRSPDPYENYNMKEHFAVNTEFFLLDPEYQCRRPNMANFLSLEFGVRRINCQNFPSISIVKNNQLVSVRLAAEDVEDISFVLAGNGEKAMSRFGHAMFKIKLKNSPIEIAAGFMGIVNDGAINNIKGLTGAYPSRIVIEHYEELLKRYNKEELRDLSEYSLRFTDIEKERFLQQLYTIYFEYSGRYYFITNNCATEALSMIKAAVNRTDFFYENSLTPKGVLKKLIKFQMTSSTPTRVHKSYAETMEKFFLNANLGVHNMTLSEYMNLSAKERSYYFDFEMANKAITRAIYALEVAILHRESKKYETEMSKWILNLDDEHQIRLILNKLIETNHKLSGPILMDEGYGIPLMYSPIEKMNEELSKMNSLMDEIVKWSKENLNSLAQEEIANIENNLQKLRTKLKSSKSI